MMNVNFICIVLAVVVCFAVTTTGGHNAAPQVACLDEQGNAVDWYIGYKFPKINRQGNGRFESGYAYAYLTSEDAGHRQEQIKSSVEIPDHDDGQLSFFLYRFKDLLLRYIGVTASNDEVQKKSWRRLRRVKEDPNPRWSMSSLPISDKNSVLLKTLDAAYNKDVNAILYNDEAVVEGDYDVKSYDSDSSNDGGSDSPRGKKKRENSALKAHAKGVLMLDEQSGQGVWVTHSVPKFPPKLDQQIEFPESAQLYGQTFMCISFDLMKTGKMVVEHLRLMRPQVYDLRVSESMYNLLPNLRDLTPNRKKTAGRKSAKGRTKLAQAITTSGGQMLNLFSKSKNFNDDLWAGWIDEELGSALYVETWRRGAGVPLNSTCPSEKYFTNNVKDLRYDENANWSYLNDHSKWAISDEKEHAYVCIGDSNRMESQFKRGGGAVCIKCPYCWSVFSNTILDIEPCPVGSPHSSKKALESDTGLLKRISNTFRL